VYHKKIHFCALCRRQDKKPLISQSHVHMPQQNYMRCWTFYSETKVFDKIFTSLTLTLLPKPEKIKSEII